jgi:hypothetical protein
MHLSREIHTQLCHILTVDGTSVQFVRLLNHMKHVRSNAGVDGEQYK